MQNNIVKAFRQRLIRDGYTDVRITCYEHYGYAHVSCTSPSYKRYSEIVYFNDMPKLPKRVYFGLS